MTTLPPTVEKVLELDGPYFDERELFLAAYADGLSEADCCSLVVELDDERNEEFAAQQAAEIAAEAGYEYFLETRYAAEYEAMPAWAK